MAYKLSRVDVSQENLAVEFGLKPLTSRRLWNEINFVHKLINGKLSYPEFLRNFEILTFNSRNNHPFLIVSLCITIFDKYN